ncbi:MAG: cytochrome c oxidase cbb3-type subunit 4 [Oleispira sp.]|jgi:cytochrome c oxidase cbb3-type subunit 4|tara:strand:+ start:416 stop:622 length:207 start_codon:yes stop_codon:yes gene_type:complete
MDINVIRGLGTVFALFAFLCIVAWAYSSRRKDRFEDDGMIPFKADNDPQESTENSVEAKKTHDDKGTE